MDKHRIDKSKKDDRWTEETKLTKKLILERKRLCLNLVWVSLSNWITSLILNIQRNCAVCELLSQYKHWVVFCFVIVMGKMSRYLHFYKLYSPLVCADLHLYKSVPYCTSGRFALMVWVVLEQRKLIAI